MDTGNQPTVPDHRTQRFRQVVCSYLERLESGEADPAEQLIQNHPDLMPELREELCRARAVFEARHIATATKPYQEAVQGKILHRPDAFPSSRTALRIQCPHCHNPIDLVVDAAFDDIVCSTCGSHFSLTGDGRCTVESQAVSQVGRFELVERIGVGAFGTVWKARDPELDRTVALKIPRKGEMSSDEVERFLREARAIAGLRHPGIVSVYEIGRESETLFIVTDLVRGVSLAHWLTGQRMSFRESAQLCRLIAEALHHAHQAGVVHRDLKPANVLLDADGKPHITDFGLAKREAREITMTVDGQVLGTPAYMSPEQAVGKSHDADARSDVYSLGVILFELLTGELPFRGNREMVVHQAINEEPPRPRKLNGTIPRDLETVCLKCLEKSPGRRYLNARELAEDLRRFLDGEPILARPVGQFSRTWRWCKRQPVVAGLTATVVVLLVSGTAFSTLFAVAAHVRAIGEATQRQRAEEGERRANHNLYFAHMRQVQRDWDEGTTSRLVSTLEQHIPKPGEPDQRGWEWYYLWGQCHGELFTMRQHVGQITCIRWARDARRFSSGSYDGSVRVWDMTKPGEGLSLSGHKGGSLALAWSPDGVQLATGGCDRLVKIWDAVSGRLLRQLAGHEGIVRCLAWSPDGKHVASGGTDDQLRLWDSTTWRPVHTLRGKGRTVWALAWLGGGTQIRAAVTSVDAVYDRYPEHVQGAPENWLELERQRQRSGVIDGGVVTWDVASGRELERRRRCPNIFAVGCEFSPDGNRLAGTGFPAVHVDGPTGPRLALRPDARQETLAESVAWSPNGQRVAAGFQDETLKVFAADYWGSLVQDRLPGRAGPQLLNLRSHTEIITAISWSPDGRHIASGDASGVIKVWNSSQEVRKTTIIREQSGLQMAVWSPDGRGLGTVCGSIVTIWDVANASERLTLRCTSTVKHIAWAPNGQRIAVSSTQEPSVEVWNAVTGKLDSLLRGHEKMITHIAWSPDGARLASLSRDATVKVWDTRTMQAVVTLPWECGTSPMYAVGGIAWSPDGKRLLWGGAFWVDHTAPVCGGQEDTRKPTGNENSLGRIWDLGTGRVVVVLETKPNEAVRNPIWSPDGRYVAATSHRMVNIWDAFTGGRVISLVGHRGPVISVAWSPDSQRIASSGHDPSIKIWDVKSGEEVLSLQESDGTVGTVDWSPDGCCLASCYTNNSVHIYSASRGYEIARGCHWALQNQPPGGASRPASWVHAW